MQSPTTEDVSQSRTPNPSPDRALMVAITAQVMGAVAGLYLVFYFNVKLIRVKLIRVIALRSTRHHIGRN